MKKLLILFCLGLSCCAFSQGKYWSINSNVNFGRTHWGSYQDFAKDYNYAFYDMLKTTLKPMKWTKGYSFGTSFIATNESGYGVYLELENEKKFAKTKAEFSDISIGTRNYAVTYSSNIYTTGLASQVSDNLIILTGIYLGFNNITLDSYKSYEDGTISYGMESGSNQKYKAKIFALGFNLGGDYRINQFFTFNVGLKLGATLFGATDFEIQLPDELLPTPINTVNRSSILSVGLKFTPVNTY